MMSIPRDSFDVIIIGGGINGTGVARDCALRGLKVLLIEKKDLCGGTSGASSGMIHGGLRYLLSDVQTTYTSSLDSGYIQKIAPFMMFRIPFLYLLKKGKGPNIELLETFFEVYDRYTKLKNGKPHTRLSKADVLKLEPGLSYEGKGAITFDEWGVDPYRLCVLNMKDALAHGGELLLHSEVVDFLFEPGKRKVIGVQVKTSDGKRQNYPARIVLNLSGPWIPKVCEKAGISLKLRPGKGVHLVFDRRISNFGWVTETIDNRQVFLMPYQNTSIIGTTDDDFYGDPDDLTVTSDEVTYLMEAIRQIFPRLNDHRVIGTYAGIRPTLYEWGKNEDNLTREHKIFDHEKDGVSGLVTMAGGKLASYRLMSEELTDVVCKKLGILKSCSTHLVPLPGAQKLFSLEEIDGMARKFAISSYALSRLYYRHGAQIEEILKMIQENTSWKRVVCASEPVLEAEIRYVIGEEWASSLDDIARRTRLSWGACQGAECSLTAAMILKDMRGNDPIHESQIFLQKRWKSLLPYLEGVSLAQEELKRHAQRPELWNLM